MLHTPHAATHPQRESAIPECRACPARSRVRAPEGARGAHHPPLTMSSAKLETPAPRGDWVTHLYRSCSALDTVSSWNVARKRRWLMCFTEAAGTSSPLCLCPRDRHEVTSGATRAVPKCCLHKSRRVSPLLLCPAGFSPSGRPCGDGCGGFSTIIPHLHEEALGLGCFASSHALEGGVLSCVHLHVTQAGEMRSFCCPGTKREVRKDLSSKGIQSKNSCTPKNPLRMSQLSRALDRWMPALPAWL